MSAKDYLILSFIVLSFLYAIYHKFVVDRLHGETRLVVPLRRRNKLDILIFVGLIVLLIYNNVLNKDSTITTTLLLVLAFVSFYMFWFQKPMLVMKREGFFFSGFWIAYDRVRQWNLSEDGCLILHLEKRCLSLQVVNLDDLEKIYKTILK